MTGRIVVQGAIKGGVGKSLFATHFSGLATSDGEDVLLVDLDAQRTASQWAAERREYDHVPAVEVSNLDAKNVLSQLRSWQDKYALQIVDAGGRDSRALRAAMVAADRLVVPFFATQWNLWAAEELFEVVRDARSLNPELEVVGVLNRISTHPQQKDEGEARKFFEDSEFGKEMTLASAALRQRKAFERSEVGLMVSEQVGRDRDEKAIDEMRAVYEEVIRAE